MSESNGGGIGSRRIGMYLSQLATVEEKLTVDIERIKALRDEHLAADRMRRLEERREAVRDYLLDHPEASANAVCVAVRGRREDVLRLVADARRPVPESGNQSSEEPEHSGCSNY